MRAVDAAVLILEKEGATQTFGLPGAAINPFYSAMRAHGGIKHVLARHVEGASHMAEGYTRAKAGNIGVCIGTSGPAGTDMITGLYSALGRLDPDPVHHRPGAGRQAAQGGLPGGRHRVDRQAGHQVGGHGDGAGPGARRVPEGVPADARGPSRPGAASTCRSTSSWPRSSSTSTPTSRCRSPSPAATRGAGREGARDADRRRAAADRGRRRRHQRRRLPTCWSSSPS